MRRIIRELCRGYKEWPLFLYGDVGTGKTCAGLCLVDNCGGMYFTAGDLCQELIDAGKGILNFKESGHKLYARDIWLAIRAVPVVVLDEVGGRDKVSDFHYDTVKGVLDAREYKPLVVISNLGLEQIAELYDMRITSRLGAGTVVEVAGDDRRLTKDGNEG